MIPPRTDLALFALWATLCGLAIALSWPVPAVAFFAFAAGERWRGAARVAGPDDRVR